MKLKYGKKELYKLGKVILSIVLGTIAGISTYFAFLYYHIDIFGWNLGLLFAPLIAGYVETIIAKKLLNESIGAISAFILFIVTVIYGFILKNPTLGINIITIGSIIIIIQAALPTLINYFFLVVIVGIISYFLGIFKKITDLLGLKSKRIYYKYLKKEQFSIGDENITTYDENLSNIQINSLDFLFLTVTDSSYKKINEYLGVFEGSVVIPMDKTIISTNYEEKQWELLEKIMKGKDQALLNLSEAVKSSGGNGVTDLTIEYELMGLGSRVIQIMARGNGVKLK